MRKTLYRITGVALIIATVLGLAVSLTGLVGLWRVQPKVTAQLQDSVDLLQRSAQATAELLVVVDGSLEQVEKNVVLMKSAVDNVAASLDGTAAVTRTVGTTVGTDLVKVIRDTQNSLLAVGAGARLVDDTLAVVSAFPLIGARYKPEQPLQTSIQDVSASLEPMPASLLNVQKGFENTAVSFESLKGNVSELGKSVEGIEASLNSAQGVVAQYQSIVSDTQKQLDELHAALPGGVRAVTWVLTGLLLWLFIAQAGLLTQGLELLRRE